METGAGDKWNSAEWELKHNRELPKQISLNEIT